MSVITPLVDTLLQNVLGRRADLDRVAARQPELPLNGITPTSPQRDTGSDTPDERLERRSELSGNNPRLRERVVERNLTETAAQAGASRYASQEASSTTHLSAEARTIARILERFPDGAQRVTASDALLTSGERPEAARLATALAGQLRHSGIFYESHLSQWLGGRYELSALLKEPQAQLSTRNLLAQQVPDERAAGTAVLRSEQVAVLRESVAATGSGAAAAAQSGSEPVHESLHGVVRHQLEVMTQPLLRLEGFFWPEVPFRWELGHESGESASAPEEDEEEQRTWHSRLQLTMPNLGELDIDVRLRGNELYVTGRVDPAALTRVTLHGERLANAFQAAGLSVAALNFSSRTSEAEET